MRTTKCYSIVYSFFPCIFMLISFLNYTCSASFLSLLLSEVVGLVSNVLLNLAHIFISATKYER
ncbi:hypothetical protein F4775DRAFT_560594 [Biscogniauxia sp. FL1348]|nr:hypothetical protein F4775DRAFT_560594 [Biscogniauxia sp. FL1348]